MIPYIYTHNRMAHDVGLSTLHPLYYMWPEEANAYDHRQQYMFGIDMMIRPIVEPGNVARWNGSYVLTIVYTKANLLLGNP